MRKAWNHKEMLQLSEVTRLLTPASLLWSSNGERGGVKRGKDGNRVSRCPHRLFLEGENTGPFQPGPDLAQSQLNSGISSSHNWPREHLGGKRKSLQSEATHRLLGAESTQPHPQPVFPAVQKQWWSVAPRGPRDWALV